MFDQIAPTSDDGEGYATSVTDVSLAEQAALVALLRERPGGRSWLELAGSVLEYGSASAARGALVEQDLFGVPDADKLLEEAHHDLLRWRGQGLTFLSINDPRFPARVRDIHEAPPFLFAQGALQDPDPAVSVVGSRKASPQGLRLTQSIVETLTSQGLTIIAGLAAGVDTVAHQTALDHRARTVAVIGTGINKFYPATNRSLQERVAETGLVLSQFWPDAPPQAHNFPMRNAVMSGYGLATIVVEAGETSGSRIQARMATQHGRPVILTKLVVDRTEWARRLRDQPDVHVASTPDEVAAIVRSLLDRSTRLHAALDALAI